MTMRIVFSRKGFDSANGGVPSPIFPDGRMCYLPIPNEGDNLTYKQLSWKGQKLGRVVEKLTKQNVRDESPVHLDPDIDRDAIRRRPEWRGLFGQTSAAQAHLARLGVGEGDLFLFFGWYRRVDDVDGRIRYVSDAPHSHVLFGWLQVGSVWKVDELPEAQHRWAR